VTTTSTTRSTWSTASSPSETAEAKCSGAGRTGRTSRPDAGPSCAERFTTPEVASVDVYQLEVDGTDTTWTFTRADLERDDWEAGLDDT
jgi:hypothetical protein